MININRHISVFDPDKFGKKPITLIGVGATGSRIAISLAKLGLENIHIWDFDIVEAHNIANQAYELADIGKPKVEALAEHIKRLTGTKVVAHNKKFEGGTALEGYVFLLTDSMKSRKEIFDKSIKNNLDIEMMIETRMGADMCRIYQIRPFDPAQCDKYAETLYDDKESEVSLCGTSITVGSTAELVSGLAVWQFIKGVNSKEQVEGELVLAVNPPMLLTTMF